MSILSKKFETSLQMYIGVIERMRDEGLTRQEIAERLELKESTVQALKLIIDAANKNKK